MELIMETFFETNWGIILFGIMIIIAIIIEFINNKPQT